MIVKVVESLKFLITLLAKERHHQKSSEYKCRVVKLCKYQKISKISILEYTKPAPNSILDRV